MRVTQKQLRHSTMFCALWYFFTRGEPHFPHLSFLGVAMVLLGASVCDGLQELLSVKRPAELHRPMGGDTNRGLFEFV